MGSALEKILYKFPTPPAEKAENEQNDYTTPPIKRPPHTAIKT